MFRERFILGLLLAFFSQMVMAISLRRAGMITTFLVRWKIAHLVAYSSLCRELGHFPFAIRLCVAAFIPAFSALLKFP